VGKNPCYHGDSLLIITIITTNSGVGSGKNFFLIFLERRLCPLLAVCPVGVFAPAENDKVPFSLGQSYGTLHAVASRRKPSQALAKPR
jgi:hypothetical protein